MAAGGEEMNKPWPVVSLREVLIPISRSESVDPERTYHILGAHWYAEGLYTKEIIKGSLIRASKVFRIERGDFVYNRLFAWKGSFAVATEENHGCYVSNEFPAFATNSDRLDPQYLWIYFSRDSIWEEALGLSTGGTPTSRNRLKEEKLLAMEMPLPPIDEQRRIVARIQELAARIEEARELRRLSRSEVDAFLGAVVSALYFEDNSWKTVREAIVHRKGSVRSGPFGSQLHHDEFVDSGIMAIGTRDVQVDRFIQNSGWYITPERFEQFKRYQVFPGDLLATIVGASIGRFCLVPDDIPLAFTTKHILAVTLDHDFVEPHFISLMLNYHQKCRKSLFSQTEGSAQPSLNATKVLETSLPIPTILEQRRIIAYLESMQHKFDALRRHQSETAAALEALLPAVLERAFRGDL